jgi:hypothetical protein
VCDGAVLLHPLAATLCRLTDFLTRSECIGVSSLHVCQQLFPSKGEAIMLELKARPVSANRTPIIEGLLKQPVRHTML